jgi:DNA-binding PucR family transcriptional regulator
VLWDLLQGPAEHRVAARSRAQQMGVQLTGALRVLYGRLENIDELATEHGWDTSRCEKVRRDALRAIVDVDASEGLALPALRGDWIVAIARNLDRNVVKDLLSRLTSTIRDAVPGVRVTWGVSRPSEDPVALPRAFGEAQTALSAVHRLGGEGVFLYEELGIVRLLLGSGDDPDLQAFINDVTGPLIAYDRENDGALIRTLRTFFDANCSQRVASERLFIHHKTLRYRLEQIKQLTGLDLSRHDDRVRADVALRLQQLDAPEDQLTTHNSNP